MQTINAQTIINTLAAAAAVAPEHRDELTERATPEWMHYNQAAPWGFDGAAEFAECDDGQDYQRKAYAASNAAQSVGRDVVVAALCQARDLLNVPAFITIQTSARGTMKIKNIRERIEAFSATVRRNAGAFGGGLVKPKSTTAPRAQSWSAGALKVARELLTEKNYADALHLARERLGALFYVGSMVNNQKNQCSTFALLAPQDCAEIEGAAMQSAMNEGGIYVVFDPISGLTIDSDTRAKTRARAIEAAAAKWNAVTPENRAAAKWNAVTPENRAAALAKAHATPGDQAAALELWKRERGIVDAPAELAPVDLETTATDDATTDNTQDQATTGAWATALAYLQDQAAENAAPVVQETTAAQAEDQHQAAELATVGATVCEADQAHTTHQGAPNVGYSQLIAHNVRVTCDAQASDNGTRSILYFTEAMRLVMTAQDPDQAPDTARDYLAAATILRMQAQEMAKQTPPTPPAPPAPEWPDVTTHTIGTVQAMGQAEYLQALETLGDANHHNEALTLRAMRSGIASLVATGSALIAQHGASGYQCAKCQDMEHALRRALGHVEGAAPAVDNPSPGAPVLPLVDNSEPAGDAAPISDPAQAADYTDPRETSRAAQLHDTPRDLETVPEARQAAPASVCTEKAETVQTLADKLQAMRQALRTGGAVVAVAPQLFPTPPALAARMARMADIQPGALVLEPSAGTGNLLEPLRAIGARSWAIEINANLCGDLVRRFPMGHVVQADFLTWTPAPGVLFDAIVMNPPFVGGVDITHITRAMGFLKPGGRLVAICAGGPRQAKALKPLVDQHGGLWEPLPANTFARSGTGVNTVLLALTMPGHKAAPTDTTATTQSATPATQAAPVATAPTPTTTKATAMKIDTIRDIIRRCNWVRQDISGGTEGEFMRANVPERMGERIDQVRALVIPPRFARDLEAQADAITYGEITIARWHRLHAAAQAADYTTPRETLGGAQLHQGPQDPAPAPKTAPPFTKMAPVAADLARVLDRGAPCTGLVGFGVDYLGDAATLPAPAVVQGAIVAARACPTHGAMVDIALEDGTQHSALPGSFFQPGGRWRLNLKNHGAPYLAQLASAKAQRSASAIMAATNTTHPRETLPTMTPTPTPTNPDTMTGAELQTLREACGLDREAFAALADVEARTLKHWENGRAGVPADVAQLARELDAATTQGAAALLQKVCFEVAGLRADHPIVLTRYKRTEDMPAGNTLPAALHSAMLGRVRLELARAGLGRPVRVVWFDADQADDAARLAAQATPHKGDQPPSA